MQELLYELERGETVAMASIVEAVKGERAIALLTVVASSGRRQAGVGQQMLVHENGQTLGMLNLSPASSSHLVECARQAIAVGKPRLEAIEGAQGSRAEIF